MKVGESAGNHFAYDLYQAGIDNECTMTDNTVLQIVQQRVRRDGRRDKDFLDPWLTIQNSSSNRSARLSHFTLNLIASIFPET